ncbi:MAG: hypothetical protein RL490_1010 [Pseudomonadota bacterium]|jgi:hypothetical protein
MKALLPFAIAALSVAIPTASHASAVCVETPGSVDYVITKRDYQVDNIIRFNEGSCSSGRGGTYTAWATESPYSLADVYYPDGHDRLMLLGTTTDLAGDEPGQKHAVIFGNVNWVTGAQGIAFGTLFPSTLEASLIAALEDAATGSGAQSSYDFIDAFWTGDAETAGLKFAPGDSFGIIAFSSGQIIGSGTTTFTPGAGGVPEPTSWAMLIAGFGLVGATLRKRRAAAVTA